MAPESKKNPASIFPEIVKTLVSFIEEKDEFVRGHSVRVAQGCVRIAKRLKLPKLEQDRLFLAGLLHDIGMVYVPQELIEKTEQLTEEEMAVVKQHPVVGEKVLAHLSLVKAILPLIRHHHESYDGSGYPDALRGGAIPAGARIIAIVDSYDAMLSARPHRPGRPAAEVLEEMLGRAGKQFDPGLLTIFAALVRPAAAPPEAAAANPPADKPGQALTAAVNDIVQKVKSGKIELPVLPNVINEIQKVIKSPIATTEDLSRVIEKDAVISLKLIATSNSSLYRGAKKVLTVCEAVPRLGLKQTQSVVNAIANRGLYQANHEEFGSLMEKLWTHALASAYAARAIAKQVKLEDIEKFFLYGLIHDIGKVLMLKALLDTAPPQDLTAAAVIPAMQQVHAEFGSMLLESWGFSRDFMQVAQLHEGPGFTETTPPPVLVVHLANMLTRAIGCSLFNDSALDLAGIESARLLGLDGPALETIRAEIQKLMQESPQSF